MNCQIRRHQEIDDLLINIVVIMSIVFVSLLLLLLLP